MPQYSESVQRYRAAWLDAYFDLDRHEKQMKPKHDLIVRGLLRPSDESDQEEVDQNTLTLLW